MMSTTTSRITSTNLTALPVFRPAGRKENTMEKITIAIKDPSRNWRKGCVENTLEAFQKIVGGYIEHFEDTVSGIHFFCNEEGKMLGMAPNVILLNGDVVVGTIFAVRCDDEGEFVSLTDEDVSDLIALGA